MGPGLPHTFAPSGEHDLPRSESACAGATPKMSANGTIAVDIAKPTNLSHDYPAQFQTDMSPRGYWLHTSVPLATTPLLLKKIFMWLTQAKVSGSPL